MAEAKVVDSKKLAGVRKYVSDTTQAFGIARKGWTMSFWLWFASLVTIVMVADEIALPLLQQMGYGPDIQMFAKYHDLVREIVGKNGVLALGLVALAVKTKHLAVAWRDEFRKRRS